MLKAEDLLENVHTAKEIDRLIEEKKITREEAKRYYTITRPRTKMPTTLAPIKSYYSKMEHGDIKKEEYLQPLDEKFKELCKGFTKNNPVLDWSKHDPGKAIEYNTKKWNQKYTVPADMLESYRKQLEDAIMKGDIKDLGDGPTLYMQGDLIHGSIHGDEEDHVRIYSNEGMCTDPENIKGRHPIKLTGLRWGGRQDNLKVLYEHIKGHETNPHDPDSMVLREEWSDSIAQVCAVIGIKKEYPDAIDVCVMRAATGKAVAHAIEECRVKHNGPGEKHSIGVVPKTVEKKIAEFLQDGMAGGFGIKVQRYTRDEWADMPLVNGSLVDEFFVPTLYLDEYHESAVSVEMEEYIQQELAQDKKKKKVFRRKKKQ
jgi:hypothetical protein